MLTFKNLFAFAAVCVFSSALCVAQNFDNNGPMPDDECPNLSNHVEIPIRLAHYEFSFPTGWYVGQIRAYQAELKMMERQVIMNKKLGPEASGIYRGETQTSLR